MDDMIDSIQVFFFNEDIPLVFEDDDEYGTYKPNYCPSCGRKVMK